jgi:hypothetical protein
LSIWILSWLSFSGRITLIKMINIRWCWRKNTRFWNRYWCRINRLNRSWILWRRIFMYVYGIYIWLLTTKMIITIDWLWKTLKIKNEVYAIWKTIGIRIQKPRWVSDTEVFDITWNRKQLKELLAKSSSRIISAQQRLWYKNR